MVILTCDYVSIAFPEECLNIEYLKEVFKVSEVEYNSGKFEKKAARVSFDFVSDQRITSEAVTAPPEEVA